MIRFTVLYPKSADSQFDLTYYLNTHLPLVKKLLAPFGLVGLDLQEGLAGDTEPAFVVILGIEFNTIEELNLGMSTHIAEMVADIPNFTNIQPVTQLSRVL